MTKRINLKVRIFLGSEKRVNLFQGVKNVELSNAMFAISRVTRLSEPRPSGSGNDKASWNCKFAGRDSCTIGCEKGFTHQKIS